MIPVTVIRHHKERRSKCSLQPLVGRVGFSFLTSGNDLCFDTTGYILLVMDAPVLSARDQVGNGLLILDATWRRLAELEPCVGGKPLRRSLPRGVCSAYPRVSKIYHDPPGGLASVEALYVAMRILGSDDPSVLDGYHWKDEFLSQLKDY